MAKLREFNENKSLSSPLDDLDNKKPEEILEILKGVHDIKDDRGFLKVLSIKCPKVWAALNLAFEKMKCPENICFLDDHANFVSNTSDIEELFDKYIKDEIINVDSNDRDSFLKNYKNKEDPNLAHKALDNMAKHVSGLINTAIRTRSDFDKSFTEAWDEVSTKNIKSPHKQKKVY